MNPCGVSLMYTRSGLRDMLSGYTNLKDNYKKNYTYFFSFIIKWRRLLEFMTSPISVILRTGVARGLHGDRVIIIKYTKQNNKRTI